MKNKDLAVPQMLKLALYRAILILWTVVTAEPTDLQLSNSIQFAWLMVDDCRLMTTHEQCVQHLNHVLCTTKSTGATAEPPDTKVNLQTSFVEIVQKHRNRLYLMYR